MSQPESVTRWRELAIHRRLARLSPVVYFVADAHGHVKIGRATDIYVRLAMIQNGQALPVRLLATVPGQKREERETHDRFRSLRVRGEWFRLEGELREFVDALTSAAHSKLPEHIASAVA
jgi:hypothetical protein